MEKDPVIIQFEPEPEPEPELSLPAVESEELFLEKEDVLDVYEQDDLVKGIFDEFVDYIKLHALPICEHMDMIHIEEMIENILV